MGGLGRLFLACHEGCLFSGYLYDCPRGSVVDEMQPGRACPKESNETVPSPKPCPPSTPRSGALRWCNRGFFLSGRGSGEAAIFCWRVGFLWGTRRGPEGRAVVGEQGSHLASQEEEKAIPPFDMCRRCPRLQGFAACKELFTCLRPLALSVAFVGARACGLRCFCWFSGDVRRSFVLGQVCNFENVDANVVFIVLMIFQAWFVVRFSIRRFVFLRILFPGYGWPLGCCQWRRGHGLRLFSDWCWFLKGGGTLAS